MTETIIAYKILVRKPEVNRQFGRHMRRFDYNIKMNFEIGSEDMD
jgi:hypothetical protein